MFKSEKSGNFIKFFHKCPNANPGNKDICLIDHTTPPLKTQCVRPQNETLNKSSNRGRRAPVVRSRNFGCPIKECPFVGWKLKFQVQSYHLTRIVWDNPQPRIEKDNVGEWTERRSQLMLILSKPSVGSERVKDLVCWAKVFFSPFIPVQSQILDQSQQISNGWNGLTRAILSYSYRSLSVLIHWIPSIYAEHLKPAQRLEYLNFGHAFMSSFYNMQRSAFQYALLHWSICQDPVYEEWWKPNPSSFIIDERNEVFLLLFSMEVQIGNCT